MAISTEAGAPDFEPCAAVRMTVEADRIIIVMPVPLNIFQESRNVRFRISSFNTVMVIVTHNAAWVITIYVVACRTSLNVPFSQFCMLSAS